MKQWREGKAVFDLIEEAVHLLRTAPVAALTVYYLGTLPFVLGLLYFWTDMSRSPFAGRQLTGAALGMAALFLWMKFWQVIFARRLRAHVAAEPAPRWTVRRWGRVFLSQAFIQPTGLFVFPLSLIPILPAGWIYAFYQNTTALDDGGPEGVAALLKKSWKQAALWPRQNLLALAILAPFGLCVFLNWTVTGLLLPHLIKMLFGVASVFTRSTFSMLNTTFFAGVAGLTYLCVDPILKAVYTLRCFYGESLVSGEDLRAELNSMAVVGSRLPTAVVVLLLGLACASPTRAADRLATVTLSPKAPVSSPVNPANLNRAISQTIHEAKYTWRMPREKIVESNTQEGILGRFFGKIGAMLRNWARAALHLLDEWLRKLFRHQSTHSKSKSSGSGWIESLHLLLYGLLTVVLSSLAILLYRVWQGRRRQPAVIASVPIQPTPDIQDENVGADQLPEDGWTKLARELLDRGELRLALRAFYFASLSHLAARNLISIARFKSNRDYEHELRRRGHSFPELLLVFGDNLLSFERVWYGLHDVNRALVDRFAGNVEKMKATG